MKNDTTSIMEPSSNNGRENRVGALGAPSHRVPNTRDRLTCTSQNQIAAASTTAAVLLLISTSALRDCTFSSG